MLKKSQKQKIAVLTFAIIVSLTVLFYIGSPIKIYVVSDEDYRFPEISLDNCIKENQILSFSKPGSICCDMENYKITSDNKIMCLSDKNKIKLSYGKFFDGLEIHDNIITKNLYEFRIPILDNLEQVVIFARNRYFNNESIEGARKKRGLKRGFTNFSTKYKYNQEWYVLGLIKKQDNKFIGYTKKRKFKLNIKGDRLIAKTNIPTGLATVEFVVVGKLKEVKRNKNIVESNLNPIHYSFVGSYPYIDDNDEDLEFQNRETSPRANSTEPPNKACTRQGACIEVEDGGDGCESDDDCPCIPDCNEGSCGDDGCGNPCPCKEAEVCCDGNCEPKCSFNAPCGIRALCSNFTSTCYGGGFLLYSCDSDGTVYSKGGPCQECDDNGCLCKKDCPPNQRWCAVDNECRTCCSDQKVCANGACVEKDFCCDEEKECYTDGVKSCVPENDCCPGERLCRDNVCRESCDCTDASGCNECKEFCKNGKCVDKPVEFFECEDGRCVRYSSDCDIPECNYCTESYQNPPGYCITENPPSREVCSDGQCVSIGTCPENCNPPCGDCCTCEEYNGEPTCFCGDKCASGKCVGLGQCPENCNDCDPCEERCDEETGECFWDGSHKKCPAGSNKAGQCIDSSISCN